MQEKGLAFPFSLSGVCAAWPGRMSFYAELGGPGILFSANLDIRYKAGHFGLGGRAGIGFVMVGESTNDSKN